jgi:hypothetical protein
MIGGGDFNLTPASMYEAYELVFNKNQSQFDCIMKARMAFPRHGHSACAIGDHSILVTGSRKDNHKSSQKCELYNLAQNKWVELPMLNHGRHYHASCGFNGQFAYVFCGIANATKRYTSNIEKLEIGHLLAGRPSAWKEIQLFDAQ